MKQKLFFSVVLVVLLAAGMNLSVIPTQAQSQTEIIVSVPQSLGTLVTSSLGSSYKITTVSQSSLINDLVRKKILGTLPKILITSDSLLPQLATRNLVKVVSNSSEAGVFPSIYRGSSFFEVSPNTKTTASIINNTVKLYGYGFASTTQFLYLNKDLVNLNKVSVDTIKKFSDAAVQSNDQSNPLKKVFGVGFESVQDPMLSLFYGLGGALFKDNTVDVAHLSVNSNASLAALTNINETINVKQAAPDWALQENGGSESLFKTNGTLAMLIASSLKYNDISKGTVFSGKSNLGLYPMPAPAPVETYSVFLTTEAKSSDMPLVKTISAMLRNKNTQDNLVKASYLPVNTSFLDLTTDFGKVANTSMNVFLDLPHDPAWLSVLDVFNNQMTKFVQRNQNAPRTTLSLDIALRLLVPPSSPWSNLPEFTPLNSVAKSSPSFLFITGLFAIFSVALLLRKRRRNNE